jgi:hypothetical protein
MGYPVAVADRIRSRVTAGSIAMRGAWRRDDACSGLYTSVQASSRRTMKLQNRVDEALAAARFSGVDQQQPVRGRRS